MAGEYPEACPYGDALLRTRRGTIREPPFLTLSYPQRLLFQSIERHGLAVAPGRREPKRLRLECGQSQAGSRRQFEKAEQMREALNGRPAEERTRRDYQRVADAYRKVYYVAPASSKADASVIAVAEILATMGRQFEPGEKDLRSAIREYEFLRHEYPGSKYRFQALFTIGQIYAEDLGDDDARTQDI